MQSYTCAVIELQIKGSWQQTKQERGFLKTELVAHKRLILKWKDKKKKKVIPVA